MNYQRLRLILTALTLPVLIWFAWPDDESSVGGQPKANDSSSPGKPNRSGLADNDDSEFPRKNRPSSNPQDRNASVDEAAMARINSLITNETLSNREVAEQLRMIAKDTRMSNEVRSEALGHGLILDSEVFASMAQDTQLPEEMADELLTHVINANDNPALQIQAFKDFLNHPSSEIRDQAKDMLAFILEDDAGEADEPTLRQMADAKLKQLEAEKLAEE